MSDTPRTDEEVEIAKKFPATEHGLWVSAEFTRHLERELAAMEKLNHIHVAQLNERPSVQPQPSERDVWNAGFYAGFDISGEGWNGEYPFGDNDDDPLKNESWLESREKMWLQRHDEVSKP